MHCGQLSDHEEWSLQAVEKHVSGGRGWGRMGAAEGPHHNLGEDDLAREMDRAGFQGCTFGLCDLEQVT